ncbi:hypothetical protein Tco_1047863 [Tanacetum coccineum]
MTSSLEIHKDCGDIRKEEEFEDDRKYNLADWRFIQRSVNGYKVRHGNGGKSIAIDFVHFKTSMLGGMGVTVNREKWPRRTKANIGKSGHSSVFIAKKNMRYNSYPFIMVLKSIEVFVSGSIHKEEEVLDNNYGFPNESKWVNRVKKKDLRHYGKCNGQMEIKMMPPEKLLLKFKSSTLSLMQVLEDKNVFKGDGRVV